MGMIGMRFAIQLCSVPFCFFSCSPLSSFDVTCFLFGVRFHPLEALAGWATVWAALVTIPPGGHRKQENVIALNMVSGWRVRVMMMMMIGE